MGILRGVYLGHSYKIAHRDIKLDNILISEELIPKVCDWQFNNNNYGAGT